MVEHNVYQNFLDFFEMRNKERPDGLSESYVAGMTSDERRKACDYLLRMVEAGGSAESIHGLFIADWERATVILKRMLQELELLSALKRMIRMETDSLAAIHAVNALLACCGVSKESIGVKPYQAIYRGLRAEDLAAKEAAFKQLDDLYA